MESKFKMNLKMVSETLAIIHKPCYQAFQKKVFTHLFINERATKGSELLNKFNQSSISELLKAYPARFINSNDGANMWYDTWEDYCPDREDSLYDLLFAYYLYIIDKMEIDAFLNFQLVNSFDGNLIEFSRYLKLLMRKYEGTTINIRCNQSIVEWIEQKKEPEVTIGKTKGKIQRSPNDNLTCLTQEVTALMIHYLQKERVILKGEYLNNKEAGQSFSLLTGFSADALRQKLNLTEIEKLKTPANLTRLYRHLSEITKQIETQLK